MLKNTKITKCLIKKLNKMLWELHIIKKNPEWISDWRIKSADRNNKIPGIKILQNAKLTVKQQ